MRKGATNLSVEETLKGDKMKIDDIRKALDEISNMHMQYFEKVGSNTKGALYLRYMIVTVLDCVITENEAAFGGLDEYIRDEIRQTRNCFSHHMGNKKLYLEFATNSNHVNEQKVIATLNRINEKYLEWYTEKIWSDKFDSNLLKCTKSHAEIYLKAAKDAL